MARRVLPSRLELKSLDGSSQRRALGEGQLHGGLVGLAGADDSGVRPHRNSPLPLLDHLGVGLLDERPDAGERLAAPAAELLDACVDEFGGRDFAFR